MTEANDKKIPAALVALAAIKTKHGKARGLRDEMPCPVAGCEGTLRYSIANVNGHVWAACSVPTCVRFMQ